MTRLVFILLSLVSVSYTELCCQTSPVKRIAPGVYFYLGDEMQQKSANCLWVVFKEYVVAIDANYPWGAEEIISEIRKTTDLPIRFIVNTHYHHDHTFGNSVFVDAGAIVISSRTTSDEMHTLGKIEWNKGTAYSGRDMKPYRREYPSVTFDQRMTLDDGNQKLELIKMGPGHTAGDLVVWMPDLKLMATGDLCVNGNPWGNNVADVNADLDHWLTILDTLASWKPEIVLPGHGSIGNALTLIEQKAYLDDMITQVRQGIKSGKTKEQLIKEIDLSSHPIRGGNKVSNERSIKAIYDRMVLRG